MIIILGTVLFFVILMKIYNLNLIPTLATFVKQSFPLIGLVITVLFFFLYKKIFKKQKNVDCLLIAMTLVVLCNIYMIISHWMFDRKYEEKVVYELNKKERIFIISTHSRGFLNLCDFSYSVTKLNWYFKRK